MSSIQQLYSMSSNNFNCTKIIKCFLNAISNYFINASFHGLRFIAQEERHWSERLLWVVLCLTSWFGSVILIFASWEDYQTKAVSFVVETSYLNTNTSFPSLSVCEENNKQKIYDTASQLWGDNRDNNLDEILKELTYFRGEVYYLKEFCVAENNVCPKDNYYELTNKARSTCDELFNACYWKGKQFNCCKHFIKTETEMGPCFMFNAAHERKLRKSGDSSYIMTTSNQHAGLASLLLEINIPTQVYMHAEPERPFYNSLSTDVLKIGQVPQDYQYGIAVTDVENPRKVRDLRVHQRNCRFPDENYLETSEVYSYSACEVDCRKRKQMELCNCTSHLMPKTKQSDKCNFTGLLCLSSNIPKFSAQKTEWGTSEGLLCNCLPGCNDAEYNIIISRSEESTNNYSSLELFLVRLPSERFKRNVVRTSMDMVVSMGGAAGLFVGASLLSFVEIFYFLTFRSRKSPKIDTQGKSS